MDKHKKSLLITCALFVLIGVLLYFNSFDNSFVWDDESQIVKNTFIQNIKNLPHFFTGGTFYGGGSSQLQGYYYKPVMTSFFSILCYFFGLNPSGYHALQVALHIINTILVFLLFSPLFPYNLSVLMAMVFLVHPIQVESVVYIAALQDVLYFFFGMLAIQVSKTVSKTKYIPLLGLLLLLATLSKETGLLFLIIVPVYSYLFRRENFQYVATTSTIVVAIYIYLRFVLAEVYPAFHWFNPMSQLSLIERILNIPSVFSFYINTFLFPVSLSIARHDIVKNLNFTNFILPLIILILLVFLLLKLINHVKRHTSNYFRTYIFFLLLFSLAIGLHLQVYPLDMSVADRWFYLPIIGLLGIISIFLVSYKLSEHKWIPFISFLIIVYFIRSYIRIDDWQNSYTLFSHDITVSKNSFDLENNFGAELIEKGLYKEAEQHLFRSIQLSPNYWISWNNLGALYLKTGQIEKAKQAFISSYNNNTQYYSAQQNLILLYLFYEKDPEGSLVLIKRALAYFPGNAKLWLYLAIANNMLGKKNEAEAAIKKSISLQRTDESTYVYQKIINNEKIQYRY